MINIDRIIYALICAICINPLLAGDASLKTKDIRVRDPFIYADTESKTYYMYAQAANRKNSGFTGVEAYTSCDLTNWQAPKAVLTLPNDAEIKSVWAPEVHKFKGKFYLFVTLTFNETLPERKPVKKSGWPLMHKRGTYIYSADSPAGPFKPLKNTSHTPVNWMALDGTLFEEDGAPYMIFCHEWVQVIDGTMDVVRLKDDLSDIIGKPEELFRASSAPGELTGPETGKVTDGCFLYRSPKSNKLFMIWSTFIPGSGYCVALTESKSGKITGPWINQKIIYKKNGGHGMLFKSFDDQLLIALHQPNSGSKERLHLFKVMDHGDSLSIADEITP